MRIDTWRPPASGALIIILATASPIVAQDVMLRAFGEQAGQLRGTAIASLGDADGDGFGDWSYGEPTANVTGLWSGQVTLHSGRDGRVLRTIVGPRAGARFGEAIAAAGDLDADGNADLVVAAPGDDGTAPSGGRITAYSGRTGNVIWSYGGAVSFDDLGVALAAGHDVDGDGVPDVAIGAPLADRTAVDAGSVLVLSGSSGTLITRHDGTRAGDRFGESVALFGDMNGDGIGEVGAASTEPFAGGRGSIRIHAGGTGSLLHQFVGAMSDDRCGVALAPAGDVDADGFADVATGCPFYTANGLRWSGLVRVWSGATGVELFALTGSGQFTQFGTAVAGIGDVDGDGHDDVAAGQLSGGTLQAFSGRTGTRLFIARGRDDFGARLSGGGHDINGDGQPDLLVGAPHDGSSGQWAGAVFALSTQPLAFTADRDALPLGAGGPQRFTLNAGPSAAGRRYLILGTFSGVRPGLPLAPGVSLPLNYDGYTSLTASAPNSVLLPGSSATLDMAGTGTAAFVLPAGTDPNLAGITLDHAFLLLPLPGGWFDFASHFVSLRLTP